MNKPINSVDDLPKDAIYSIKALREMFKESSFESEINEVFLYNYNQARKTLK